MAPLRRGFIFFAFFLLGAITVAAPIREPLGSPVLHSLRSYYNHIRNPLANQIPR